MIVWAGAWTWAEHLEDAGNLSLAISVHSSTDNDEWKDDWAQLENAVDLNPLRAEYFLHQASVAQQLAWLARKKPADSAAFYDQSLVYYNQVLSFRPHWGTAWAKLARMQYQQGKVVEEIFDSLDKARTFAPYEPSVRRVELELTMPLWDRLDKGQRQQLVSSVRYFLQHDSRLVINTALSGKWAEHLKPLLTEERDITYFNRKLEAIKQATAE